MRILPALICALLLSAAAFAEDPEHDRAVAAALDHLAKSYTPFGLEEGDLDDLDVGDLYVSRHTGTTHVYLRQRLHGIEIHGAVTTVAVARDGTVAHVAERLVPGLERRAETTAPKLSAAAAVERAALALGLAVPKGLRVLASEPGPERRTALAGGGISRRAIPARLVYQPLADGRLRLAWDLAIEPADPRHWWSVRIDAEDGRLLDTTDWVADERYEVYPLPLESPNHASPAPPADARQVVTDPFAASAASPWGWHDADGVPGPEFTITRGNNVHAYADVDGNGLPDGGAAAEPDGGAALDFTGPVVAMDLDRDPGSYTRAAIANLFYWNNVVHDLAWEYGFDEPAGNFQVDNYGRGGVGGDDVRAEAQDGGGTCNANFATPPDGARPRMQMFTCDAVSPARDGAFDHGVIVHEYAHGISNRLTGGPSTAGCLANDEQMGEGWSDYLALMLTLEPGDLGADPRPIATYLVGEGADGDGIRPAPYSTDFGVNDFTYGAIPGLSIPHGVGFVWATALWDMTWELIADRGSSADLYAGWTAGGNNLALQLVMDGMKLQPCSPGFVDGRDAILAADDLLTGDGSRFSGAHQCAIWRAFARRGLGAGADQGTSASAADGTEAFDRPAACETLGVVESSGNVCQGETASYRVGVGEGFTAPPVTLSVSGEPAGTSTSFSVDPVAAAPGISDLTISGTGSAVPGDYLLTITGTDGTPTAFEAPPRSGSSGALPPPVPP